MAIARPMKRKEKKAIRFLDTLIEEVQANPRYPVRGLRQAQDFAQALVLAALFNPAERELFATLYERRDQITDEEIDSEIGNLCEQQGEEHLCRVIAWIFAGRSDDRLMHYLMRTLEDDLWQPVAEELRAQGLTTEHFMWEIR
ncbi:MAG: hypothetical protein ACLFU8_04230 [Anaerolineales bacterium]